jgi:rhodanese-related sulfurtransferase
MIIKKLNNSALLFFFVIVFALVFQWITAKSYKTNKKDVLSEIVAESAVMTFAEFHGIIESEKMGDYIFVDIRPEDQFEESNIENSIGIPLEDILTKKARRVFKKEKPKVIIANREPEAHFARITLIGKGFKNIIVLSGSYDQVIKHVIDSFNPAFGYYSEDKAKFDYPGYMKNTNSSGSDAKSQDVETKKVTVSGGC